MKKALLFSALFIYVKMAKAQLFTKVTDTTNAIVTAPAQTNYNGVCWIDYDSDGKLDLFIVKTGLYHNLGNGQFADVTSASGLPVTGGLGTTWADYDNDGDPDCFIAGGTTFGSKLFTNNGNGTFTQNTGGPFGTPTKLRGWSAAWGDYDNDGLVDIAIAAPINFAGITDSNKLLHNDGGGNFTRIDTTPVTCCEKPYTVVSWSDYDQDGDADIFIGSGPANGTLGVDYMYQNELSETGIAFFSSSIPAPVSTDTRDGQNWNWIDFDNDGDLDGYVTNYVGLNANDGDPNDFYRNDNGIYIKLTAADVGPIVGDSYTSLANIWEDFDNDGDLDCIVINDGGQDNNYYESNIMQGSTVFTKVTNEPFISSASGQSFSVTAGDYDNDGDIDAYVTAASTARGLYRNNLSNGNHWINIHLTGVTSNKSAIGAQVHAKATINGNEVWQMREVSAENSFNGMNSLNVEFGLGDATEVDSLIIRWPSGIVDQCSDIAVNQFYDAEEGNCPVEVGMQQFHPAKGFLMCYPNPFKDYCRIRVVAPASGVCSLKVLDQVGKSLFSFSKEYQSKGTHDFFLNGMYLPAGVYLVYFEMNNSTISEKIVLTK